MTEYSREIIETYFSMKGESAYQPIKGCDCRACRTQRWPDDPTEELCSIGKSQAELAEYMIGRFFEYWVY